jgi:hypothetical protein
VREQSDDELVLPEEVERDDRRNDIGCELRRVDLVKEDFLFEGHAVIVAC